MAQQCNWDYVLYNMQFSCPFLLGTSFNFGSDSFLRKNKFKAILIIQINFKLA